MKLQITYEWFDESNRGKTKELDKALEQCLDEFGFSMVDQKYDIADGVRSLKFETEECTIRTIER